MPQAADGIMDSFMQGREWESDYSPDSQPETKKMSVFMFIWDMQKKQN